MRVGVTGKLCVKVYRSRRRYVEKPYRGVYCNHPSTALYV